MLKIFLVGLAEIFVYLIRPNKFKVPFRILLIEKFEAANKP